MKRIVFSICMILTLVLTACGSSHLIAEESIIAEGEKEVAVNAGEASTEVPTEAPTEVPTEAPTEVPTIAPIEVPAEAPTEMPIEAPTEVPTIVPIEVPAETPTEMPTEVPTETPTEVPTEAPTEVPTEAPTQAPTAEPVAPPVNEVEKPVEPAVPIVTEAPTPVPTVEVTPEPVVCEHMNKQETFPLNANNGPTCLSGAEAHVVCLDCGREVEIYWVEELGHDLDEDFWNEWNQCKHWVAGSGAFVSIPCKRCGDNLENRPVTATHNYVVSREYLEVVEGEDYGNGWGTATIAYNITEYECTSCGNTYTDSEEAYWIVDGEWIEL